MAGLVVLERHLWLTLTEIKDADKVSFLDAPISPSGLFGPAVKGFAERFTEAQKASQVMRHFLPSAPAQQLLRVALRLRRLSSPRSLHLPFPPLSLPRLSRHEGVHAQPDATPFRSVRGPVGPCASGVLLICRTGRGESRDPPRPDRPPKGLS